MKRRAFFKAVSAAIACGLSSASLAFGAVSELCSKVLPRRRTMVLPPLPKWNNGTDDIDSHDFLRRCQDYERSQLPADILFPRPGQIWEAVRDCEVQVLKCIDSKRMCGVPTRLQQGERVCIVGVDAPKALQVTFQPVRHQELHESIAPKSFRSHFSMRMARTGPAFGEVTGYFNEMFKMVQDVR